MAGAALAALDREKASLTGKTVRYIPGYLAGGLMFLVAIPTGLYRASRSLDSLTGIELIPSGVVRLTVAAILLLLGLSFALWSIVVQNRIGQGGPLEVASVEVSPKTRNLVVTGPYKYTRNPMLFGACVYYYAIAVYLNSVPALAIVVLFMVSMLIFVRLTEERRLLKDFRNDYDEYRRRVSMFVPWIQKRPRSTNA